MQKMKVAAVSVKNWINDKKRSIADIARWSQKAADRGAELVVFPELGVGGYVHHESAWDFAESVPGPSTEAVAQIAAKLNITICFGILERHRGVTYNTQVLVNGNGFIGKQQKIHMPGDEYLYWRAGSELNVFDIGKARVGIAICYDALFPEMTRALYNRGAEVLIMPFAYPSKPRARFPEEDISGLCYRTACYGNGCYGIICNNAGNRKKNKWEKEDRKFPGWAGIIDPHGEVAAFTREKGNGEAMAVTELDPAKLEAKRRNVYFLPRCVRPEVYGQAM